MGGAVAALPDGAGNQTPNAEFNWRRFAELLVQRLTAPPPAR